jgi:ferrous iron transport protein A
MLKTGKTGTIHSLNGGRGFKSRLSVLGFTPGTEVRMIQNFGRGPLIVEIKDANIALGRGEAMKVIIEESEDG